MSIHYLIDRFDDQINAAVIASSLLQTRITGNYVVRVPDAVEIDSAVASLASLTSEKYQGILGNSGLFGTILYDDMSDPVGVDVANSNGITTGVNGVIGLYPVATGTVPVLRSTMNALGSTPTQAQVIYELFEYVDDNDKNLLFTRDYKEVAPDTDVTCAVSFNNGVSFTTTTDQGLLNVPVPDQGNQFIIRFTRTSTVATRGRILIGSWALLY